MAGVVSAASLLASAAAAAPGGAPGIAYKHDDLTYDLGMLAAFDTHPLEPAAYRADKERALAAAATAAAQLLVRRIWELPLQSTDLGPVALLPPRASKLPRALPPPGPKAPTRWEKFAKEKGIEKKKRSRLVFDEAANDYKPRWGKDRHDKESSKDWLIPVKDGHGKKKWDGVADPMDGGEDEFSKRDLAKKDRQLKNQLNQLKNIKRATKGSRGGAAGGAEGLLGAAAAVADAGGSSSGKGAASKKRARSEPDAAPRPTKKVLTFEGGGGVAAGGGAAALVAPRIREVDVAPPAARAQARQPAPGGKAAAGKLGKRRGAAAAAAAAGGAAGDAGGRPAGLPTILTSAGEGRVDAPHLGAGKSAGRKLFVKEPKEVKSAKLKLAQGSTASMGRFDRALAGEPAKPKDKRLTKRLPTIMSASSESSRNSSILKSVLGGSAAEGERAAPGGVRVPSAAAHAQQAAAPHAKKSRAKAPKGGSRGKKALSASGGRRGGKAARTGRTGGGGFSKGRK